MILLRVAADMVVALTIITFMTKLHLGKGSKLSIKVVAQYMESLSWFRLLGVALMAVGITLLLRGLFAL